MPGLVAASAAVEPSSTPNTVICASTVMLEVDNPLKSSQQGISKHSQIALSTSELPVTSLLLGPLP